MGTHTYTYRTQARVRGRGPGIGAPNGHTSPRAPMAGVIEGCSGDHGGARVWDIPDWPDARDLLGGTRPEDPDEDGLPALSALAAAMCGALVDPRYGPTPVGSAAWSIARRSAGYSIMGRITGDSRLNRFAFDLVILHRFRITGAILAVTPRLVERGEPAVMPKQMDGCTRYWPIGPGVQRSIKEWMLACRSDLARSDYYAEEASMGCLTTREIIKANGGRRLTPADAGLDDEMEGDW